MISHLKLVQLTRKASIVLMPSVGTLFFNMHFKFHLATMKELLTRLCIQRFSLRWTLFIGILVLSPKLSASKWEMLIPNNNKKIQPEDTKSWRQTWQQTDIKDLKSSWQSKKKKIIQGTHCWNWHFHDLNSPRPPARLHQEPQLSYPPIHLKITQTFDNVDCWAGIWESSWSFWAGTYRCWYQVAVKHAHSGFWTEHALIKASWSSCRKPDLPI